MLPGGEPGHLPSSLSTQVIEWSHVFMSSHLHQQQHNRSGIHPDHHYHHPEKTLK
jgi:hypothetical protein